jgi:hypothetical protein
MKPWHYFIIGILMLCVAWIFRPRPKPPTQYNVYLYSPVMWNTIKDVAVDDNTVIPCIGEITLYQRHGTPQYKTSYIAVTSDAWMEKNGNRTRIYFAGINFEKYHNFKSSCSRRYDNCDILESMLVEPK